MFSKITSRFAMPLKLGVSLLVISAFNTHAASQFNPVNAWQEVEHVLTQQYAYFDRIDNANLLLSDFKKRALTANTPTEFNNISQQLMRHFHDPHLNLGPYDEHDFSVFPTGSDIRAVYKNNAFIIEDIKAGSAADKRDIALGAHIIEIDNKPVSAQLETLFGKPFDTLLQDQIEYGVNVVLGGLRNQTRQLTLRYKGQVQTHKLAASYDAINALAQGPTLSYRNIDGIGYIRFHNSLGNSQTVATFKKAITSLLHTRALIIDLRNTPSGGNTGVAEPILGHFVTQKTAYQTYRTHTDTTPYHKAPMHTAFVTASRPHYAKPFIVLAGRWTGSMGEGMTIGFDAIGAKTVIGAPMADLLGGIKTVTLKHSNAWLELPYERLYHVNGIFREDFTPHILVVPTERDNQGGDPALEKGIDFLKQSTRF